MDSPDSPMFISAHGCLEYVKEHATKHDPQSILTTIETFAKTHDMMNVGAKKGAIVDTEIKLHKPQIMAELGSYTGYSAVRFASLQREVCGPDSRYFAFEYSPEYAKIVEEMVEFAGLENQVNIIVGAFADTIGIVEVPYFDMVFVDHDKQLYTSDVKLMEARGMLPNGSVVTADNILYPGAPEFLQYMQSHSGFTMKLHQVELDNGKVDAVLVAIAIA